MYQIEIFQKWLLTNPTLIQTKNPFWDWMKFLNRTKHGSGYVSKGSTYVFHFSKQEQYLLNHLEEMPYPLTNDQIIKILNRNIVLTKYEYN